MENNNNPVVATKRKVRVEKWGDAEHDTGVHKNLRPHKGKPDYDPRYGTYRSYKD